MRHPYGIANGASAQNGRGLCAWRLGRRLARLAHEDSPLALLIIAY